MNLKHSKGGRIREVSAMIGKSFMIVLSCMILGAMPLSSVCAEEAVEVRLDEVKQVKTLTGKLSSLREEKIVMHYKPDPEARPTDVLQISFVRNEDTVLMGRGADVPEPGDHTEVTFEESAWMTAEGKKHKERIARLVRVIKTKEDAALLEAPEVSPDTSAELGEE